MSDQKIYSIVINWDDNDILEQGTFGWAGTALDDGDAELKARAEMFESRCEGMTEKEYLDEQEDWEGRLHEYGGSVVETYTGANIWAAPVLLEALKGVLPYLPGALDRDTTGRPWLKTAFDAIAKAECRDGAV